MRVGFSRNHIITNGMAMPRKMYVVLFITSFIVRKNMDSSESVLFVTVFVLMLTFLGLDKYKAAVTWCGLICPINYNFLCNKTQ